MAALAHYRRAEFDYNLLAKYEAGLNLRGHEVKAVRAGKMSLAGARVIIRGGEAYLVGASIQPYQPANPPPGYEPDRSLRLLLTKKEISELAGAERQKGLTIIPISVYDKRGRLKLELALARGKKKYDKREALKRREAKRKIERTLKNRG